MAQTKTRASTKRTQGSKKSQARSRGSSSKSKGKSQSKSQSQSNGAGQSDSTMQKVEHTAKDAGQAVGRAASKAKVPLVASGAALAGAAGGVALGARMGRRRGVGPRPQVKVKSRDIAKAAQKVGAFGAQMGHLASELQHARETNGGKNRSPVEVVLDGLTARRSRS
jgi:hypothetical protein